MDLDDVSPTLGYELIQGPLARWTRRSRTTPPFTAVLVHGILGSRRNMQSFARMLVEGFPSWQVLLVDLRCHGESAALGRMRGRTGRAHSATLSTSDEYEPHTLTGAARDILDLLNNLKLFPNVLIGHSFGGKVVLSMVEQFGAARLPRPVQVWVLDSLPGEVRSGESDGRDHPERLITTLKSMPQPVRSRGAVVDSLVQSGFSDPIAKWAATNLVPVPGSAGASASLVWGFDLEGIHELYQSYETTSMWSILQAPPEGLKVDFVKAERSTFRWGGGDEQRIHSLGHRVHLLRNSGHWVHADNPLGLFDIMAPSFGAEPDVHLRRNISPNRTR